MKIEDLIKGGQLTEIEIDKVSLVKSPANQRRFVFTKQANIEFSGSTDQTFDGTTITVNGEELEDVESFHFSLVNWSDEDIEEWGASPVSLSFSTKKATADGLDVIETFSLHSEVKKTMEKTEVIKTLKEGLGIELDEAGYDKMPVEKQKALTGMAIFSPALNGQPAFREAVTYFMKSASAEATDLPADPPTDPPTDPPAEKPKPDTRLDAIEASIKDIQESLKKPDEPPEKKPDETDVDDTAPEPVTKADIDKVTELVRGIAKAAGYKESSETDISKGGDVVDDYPSIKL